MFAARNHDRRARVCGCIDRSIQRFADLRRIDQRPQAGYIGQILPEQLVHQAPVAYLVLRMLRIVGPHSAPQSRSNLVGRKSANFLNIVLAIEEIGI